MTSMSAKTVIRRYVEVAADFDTDGIMRPLLLIWEDGRKYEIDKVIDIRQAHAQKAGGQGDRYTVLINGRERYLFFERNSTLTGNCIGRWFVEQTMTLDEATRRGIVHVRRA